VIHEADADRSVRGNVDIEVIGREEMSVGAVLDGDDVVAAGDVLDRQRLAGPLGVLLLALASARIDFRPAFLVEIGVELPGFDDRLAARQDVHGDRVARP